MTNPRSSPVGSDGLYRTLVENAAAGTLTIDAENRIVYANAAIESILGARPKNSSEARK